jgi:hypothetical protein
MNDDMSQGRSSSSSGGPDTRSQSASPLDKALEGAVYPLSAEQLSLVARENGAPSAVLTLLAGLPRGTFRSLDAVESRLRASSTQR